MRMKRSIQVIDYHTCGEPLRIVPAVTHVPGKTMEEKFRYAQTALDDTRRLVTHEPRGHRKMFGCFLTEPVNAGSLFGVLFFDTTMFNAACGAGAIALATAAMEMGWVKYEEGSNKLHFDIPPGQVELSVEIKNDEVVDVRYRGVPSFVFDQGIEVDTSIGRLVLDVAFGGVFFAINTVEHPDRFRELQARGSLATVYGEVKKALDETGRYVHPEYPSIRSIDGVHFISENRSPVFVKEWDASSYFSGGELDRSPCGNGTAACMALYFARRELGLGQEVRASGPTGQSFKGKILSTTQVAGRPAIVPEIRARGYLTGMGSLMLDASDPLNQGFLLA